ncbi:MAG: UDP-N-acetylglucosamine 2-epimerase, partial [Desulfobacterales bacterium]
MTQGQQLPVLTATLLQRLDTVIQLEKPDTVLVHGDTITALAAAMAAFFR